ncbi:NACHT-sigma domain-containing protein [Fusarium keratoplasticum]|uniref:NACHT-sigma domain-containing protein n=1 Tax=Fusarium keratoplasticum TaxID=1328300 RepID=A0ACC0QU97_9HYPO|nr:NACHT-sigma domain-containing protein [Fusarium keratoplasticum]KAI8666137.1 NACHT-sigma domain-containing protein [Fusarium keratoplasticum]
MEYQAWASGDAPSHTHGDISHFNTYGGYQYNNTGNGNQFPGASFNGPVYFGDNANTRQDQTRRSRENALLKRLHVSPYQDRKERNPDRVPETCDWFVSHRLFREWKESQTSRILWVSADPGCGKSVLAKYLVDQVLPTTQSRTVCYFFFKDDFEDQKSVVSALSCILRQLFLQKRNLLSDSVLDQFDTNGELFTSSFSELWKILLKVAEDERAGEIVCLLDAIDECEDLGRSQLTQALVKLYGTRRNFNLKFLITSRPYGSIRRGFQPLELPELPMIHLSGESEAEMLKISHEIDIFIEARIRDVGARLRLTEREQHQLLGGLKRVPNRTYLWVHLTLDLIENEVDLNKTGLDQITSQIPESVEAAYNRILAKSRDPETAKKLLHIVVAAARPLTLEEMTLALTIQPKHKSYSDIELEPEKRFREKIRDICGLFVTVIDSRIYLLHQTAKEFLVRNQAVGGNYADLPWKHSLLPEESHRLLAEICTRHLLFADFESPPVDKEGNSPSFLFLDYSAKHWASHVRELSIEMQERMTPRILKLCTVKTGRGSFWFGTYWSSTHSGAPRGFTSLMLASYFGLERAVKCLLETGDEDLNTRDYTHQRTAISWAAGNGFGGVVKLLLKDPWLDFKHYKRLFKTRTKIDLQDVFGRTPLTYAIWSGNAAVVRLLLKAGARKRLEDKIGGTPLSYAFCSGRKDIADLLLKGRNQDDLNEDIKALLFSAVRMGDADAVARLLETDKVNASANDNFGNTPLDFAVEGGIDAIVKLLLDTGNVEVGADILPLAARKGKSSIVQMLLESGKVDVNVKDSRLDQAPLLLAARSGFTYMVQLLLDTGKADVDTKDSWGRTPLLWAAANGHGDIVEKLLKTGKADVNARDMAGRTPLAVACEVGHSGIVKQLLAIGNVFLDTKDHEHRTPLWWATHEGHEEVVWLLVATGKVDLGIKDRNGMTLRGMTNSPWISNYIGS